MTTRAPLFMQKRNPDILTCIASLSNDEVFTPPDFANRMLDTVAEAWAADNDGENIWTNSSVTFLDPCTKSGVFLREITRRLTDGLATEIPDLQDRVNHILTKQVFGVGITRLTSLMARRSLYCSKHAQGSHSIANSFATDDGNIWYERVEHTWEGNRCKYCGASTSTLDRGDDRENYAYAFIHTDNVKSRITEMFGANMQFDVIIGNPPYQMEDGGHGTSASPIYHLFVDQALKLEPKLAVFVIPSRWMTGGKGLDQFRSRMLNDSSIKTIIDFPKLYEAFPGVKIRGGVSYFLWDRYHAGQCEFVSMWDGKPVGPSMVRSLNEYDVLVRWNEAIPILSKVRRHGESTLDRRVSSRKPFGFGSNVHGKESIQHLTDPVKFYGTLKVTWIDRCQIEANVQWIDKWKVLMTKAQGTSGAIERMFLSRPIVAAPGSACSETYLVAGCFDSEIEAENMASYLRTRFVRFLVALRKSTQNAAKDVYAFVPELPFDQLWTDDKLYARYALNDKEIHFIESMVGECTSPEMDDHPVNDDE